MSGSDSYTTPGGYTGLSSEEAGAVGLGGGSLGGLGGLLGGSGGGTLTQLLPLLEKLLGQQTHGFGGSFPHVRPDTAPGRTEPLQFGAAPVAPVTSPAERLALVMRGLG